ncbi:MAG: DUF1631 family protein [Rhizobacter sp.]|nr:DUF1631 family protein [Rhizobacter sp.]
MPIAPLLQSFVDDELARAPGVVERTLAGTLQLLRDSKDGSLGPGERSLHFALVEALQHHGQAYQGTFVDALRSQVFEVLAEQDSASAPGLLAMAGGLELMDESRVEVDIEISRAMQRIDTTAEWELRELQMFTSTLVGQTHVSAESNPFRPLVYATALWQAACAVTPVQDQRMALLRTSAGVIAGLLKTAWAAACTRLESQGVEPGIYRTVLLAPGSTPQRGPPPLDASQPGAMASMLSRMPSGAGELRLGVGNTSAPVEGIARRAGDVSPEFQQTLARLDERLRHLPAPAIAASPSTATSTSRNERQADEGRLNSHRAALVASVGHPVDRQIIELLSRVFDAMLGDPLVPVSFLAVLARLQSSALRVALNDNAMLESKQHPVWQVLDRIGEAAFYHPQPGDPRSAAALVFCQNLADELAGITAPDAALYRRVLGRIEASFAEALRSELQAAAPALVALELAERRELLERNLSQRLVDQMVPMRTSPGVRRFVTATWAKVLAESVLRFGEQDDATRGYVKLVDELLWSVQLPDHPRSRQRLLALLPNLLARLRAGMALIDLPGADQERLLDELMAIHTEALRPGGRAGAGNLSPEQIVQRLRDEDLAPPASMPLAFADSVIDLGSMETVPAEMMLSEPAKRADDMARHVDQLRPSDRLRLFLVGRWARVQLLWRSEHSMYYLFAGETPVRTYSVTRRALERLAAEGLMQTPEARTLVERALDSVMRDLVRPL